METDSIEYSIKKVARSSTAGWYNQLVGSAPSIGTVVLVLVYCTSASTVLSTWQVGIGYLPGGAGGLRRCVDSVEPTRMELRKWNWNYCARLQVWKL